MKQIYVLMSVLLLLLGFAGFMHQTQYQNARAKNTPSYAVAQTLDSLDPAAGISYNSSDDEVYTQVLNRFDGQRIYLNK